MSGSNDKLHWPVNVSVAGFRVHCQGPGAVVLTGDSRAETCTWSTLADRPFVQAGFAGCRLRDASVYAPLAVAALQASAVIIHVGINNMYLYPTDPENLAFKDDYATLIRAIVPTTSRIICTTIIPPEKGFGAADSDTKLRGLWMSNLSKQIIDLAAASSLPCVDLNGAFRLADLTALPGTTCDGIHYSAATWSVLESLLAPAVRSVFSY